MSITALVVYEDPEIRANLRELLAKVELIAVNLDLEGRITFCNDYLLRLTGWAREEVNGRSWFDLFIPPDRRDELWRAFFDPALREHIAVHHVNEILTRAGERRLIDWNNSILRDADGRLVGTISLGEDITERRRSEEALRASEERFSRAFEVSPDAIVISRQADGQIVEVNRAWESLFGLRPEEVVGRTSTGLGLFADEKDNARAWGLLRDHGSVRDFELDVRHKSGAVRHACLSCIPIQVGGEDCFLSVLRDITDRKRSEAALREGEERLRLAIDATGMGIWSSEVPAPDRYEWSDRLKEIWGLPRDRDVTPSLALSLVHPEDRQRVTQAMEAALEPRGDGRFALEHRVCRPDGAVAWVQAWGQTLFQGDGPARRPVRSVGVILDVTDRKRSEEVLRAGERRWKDLAEALPQLVWTCAPDGRCDYLSRQWVEYTGLPEADQLGYGWLGRVHPDDRERLMAAWDEAVAGGGRFDIEYRVRRADGVYRSFLTLAVPVRDAAGRVAKWFGSNTDIEDQRRALDSLRESEDRFRAFMDNSTAIAWMKDEQGRYVYLSRPYEERFAVRLDDWRGKTDFEVWNREVAEEFRRNDESVLLTGRPVEAIEHTPAGDGYQSIWLNTKFPFRDASGRRYVGGIGIEITELKRLEREVVEAASGEQRRIGQDLHDTVGQELTALNILASDLADALRTDPAGAAMLGQRLARGLRRCQKQLRVVLRGLLPVPVDREGLMAALGDLAERTHQGDGIDCEFECPEPVTVADNLTATHLYLIAQEAVHNAVKHARPGTIRIGLTAGNDLVLRVQDDGDGPPSPPRGGSGLGLRIMRNRAAIIGARLTVEPVSPTGTVVTCVLTRSRNE